MTTILGCETTKGMEALTAFIAEAEAHYQALEQAIAAVDEKIANLQKDWELRPVSFWSPILRTTLPAIRQTTAHCLGLFSPRGSQWKSVPPIIFGTGLACIVNFHSIEAKVEEAGILLTAYLRSSSSLYSGTRRHVEAQIRERQCLLRALEQVSQAVHDAVDNGRLKLKSMPEEQCKSQEEGDPYDE